MEWDLNFLHAADSIMCWGPGVWISHHSDLQPLLPWLYTCSDYQPLPRPHSSIQTGLKV